MSPKDKAEWALKGIFFSLSQVSSNINNHLCFWIAAQTANAEEDRAKGVPIDNAEEDREKGVPIANSPLRFQVIPNYRL